MRTKFAAFAAVVGLIVGTGSVVAHHSFAAEFDANKPMNLKGIVTKIEWQNPHTFFLHGRDRLRTARSSTGAWKWAAPTG